MRQIPQLAITKSKCQVEFPSEKSESPEIEMHSTKANDNKPLEGNVLKYRNDRKTESFHKEVTSLMERLVYMRVLLLGVKFGYSEFIQLMIFFLVLWFLAAGLLCIFSTRILPKWHCFYRAFRSFRYKSVMFKFHAVKELFKANDYILIKEFKKTIGNYKVNNWKRLVLKQEIKKIGWKFQHKKRNKRKWKLLDYSTKKLKKGVSCGTVFN